jgi:hypothetical protein
LRVGTSLSEKNFSSSENKVYEFLASLIIPTFLAINAMLAHLPDRNFDRRNSYEYNIWALINNRFGDDWMAAGVASFLNPIVNLPAYAIGKLSLTFSFVYGLAFLYIYAFLIWRMILILDIKPLSNSKAIRILSVSLCCANPLFLAELGTAMSGYTSSIFTTASLFLFLRAVKFHKGIDYYLSGALMLLAVHFKLVNIAALLAMIPCFYFVNRQRLKNFLFYTLGAASTSFLFVPWYLFVFIKFGNPVFPFFNKLFKSEFFPEVNFKDTRWVLDTPEKLLQLLTGLWKDINTEIPAFDFRILLLSVFFIVFLSTLKMKSFHSSDFTLAAILLVWFTSFTMIWIETSFIARYFMPGELIVGLILIILTSVILDIAKQTKQFFLIILILTVATLKVPNWNTWQTQYLNQNTTISNLDQRWQFPLNSKVSVPAQYLTLGEPISYIFQYFPNESSFINIGWPKFNSGVEIPPPDDVMRKVVRAAADNKFLTALPLANSEEIARSNSYLKVYKLRIIEKSCYSFRTSSEEFWICSLKEDV